MTKAKLYICDAMDGKAFETHEVEIDPKNAKGMRLAVKAVLGQWMEDDDVIDRLESHTDARGTICPYLIRCAGSGEHSDIFAQLVF